MKKFDYEVTFNKKEYKSYKDFFEDISKKLEAVKNGYYDQPETLGYHCDWLWEYLEDTFHYCGMKLKATLKNFDKEKIAKKKTYDDYRYEIMLKVINRLAEMYPENVVEYVFDEEKETK